MSRAAIQFDGVTKAFGSTRAVNGLSLAVPEGSVFGLLGPNGAGKTTAIRMLMGHLHPTQGTVRTLGEDPWGHTEETRRRIAYVSENMALPGWMTPEAAVRFCARLYPAWDGELAETLLEELGLRGGGRFPRLSKGQRRSLCILLALCQNAELLVLDEPAAGLDPLARRGFLQRILEVACGGGRTVFISSHILSDLERVVDRVAIIARGKLKLDGELEDLKQSARKLVLPSAVSAEQLNAGFQVLRLRCREEATEAFVLGFDEDRFRSFCAEQGCAAGAQQFGLNLEDLFVEVAQADSDDSGSI
jgi:ABC-2 type transport system ATP-binding protein